MGEGEEVKGRRRKTETVVEESEVGRNRIGAEKETEKMIDEEKTHEVGGDKANLTLSEPDLYTIMYIAVWLHSLVPLPRHVETQNLLPN